MSFRVPRQFFELAKSSLNRISANRSSLLAPSFFVVLGVNQLFELETSQFHDSRIELPHGDDGYRHAWNDDNDVGYPSHASHLLVKKLGSASTSDNRSGENEIH